MEETSGSSLHQTVSESVPQTISESVTLSQKTPPKLKSLKPRSQFRQDLVSVKHSRKKIRAVISMKYQTPT